MKHWTRQIRVTDGDEGHNCAIQLSCLREICVQKLKAVLERGMLEGEAASNLAETERGILDIAEAGARLVLQSGYLEKAVAL